VIKRDGRRESFNRSKLLRGLVTACGKTGVSLEIIETVVDDIEASLQVREEREIASAEIGEAALQRLRDINEVAYVRFASVYRQFQGIDDFVQELRHLQDLTQAQGDDGSVQASNRNLVKKSLALQT
jgi:transcriptional repressor NrdR